MPHTVSPSHSPSGGAAAIYLVYLHMPAIPSLHTPFSRQSAAFLTPRLQAPKSALLASIEGFSSKKLKKAATNDRSAPLVKK